MLIYRNAKFQDQHHYMTHNYTSTQVLQFIYNELPALEHLEVEHAIENDGEWNETYHRLKSAFNALPKVKFFPSQSIVRSILQYSRMTT